MAISYTSVMRAINNLTKPLQEKALKKLGLSTTGKPGRTSKKAGITVGKDRVNIKEKIDKYKGAAVGGGAVVAAYETSDFIRDLLGIKQAGKGSKFTKEELAKLKKKKVVKKTPPKAPPPKPDSVKKKVKVKKKVGTPPKKKKNGVTFEFKVGGKKDGR
mgnify:CR=1 FL=1